MANYTEKAIFRAFEELLEEKPFDKITVSAIVSKSEVSANTFYYHFQDIYDLLDKWLDRKKNQSFAMTQLTGSWTDRLKVLLHAMQETRSLSITFPIPSRGSVWNGMSLHRLKASSTILSGKKLPPWR